MKSHFLILLLFIFKEFFCFKANHQVDRITKSIFSDKRCKESFTPARYIVGINNIKFDQPAEKNSLPEQYFPDVAYPTSIMEASRPFFYKTGESYAILGPFPDDVKSSYKALMDNNMKPFEEIKINYKNEFGLNAQNCIQENTDSVVISKENEEDVFVDEVINEEISQNVTVVENITVEEIERNDTLSKSEEKTGENDEKYQVLDQVFLAMKENKEEEATANNYFQSWESEQIYSDEIIMQLSETDELGSALETQIESEEIQEEANISSESVETDEEVSKDVELENAETDLCSITTPENNTSVACDNNRNESNNQENLALEITKNNVVLEDLLE